MLGEQAIARVEQPSSADDLVRQAQSGDLEAFEAIYRRYAGRAYAICLRMTGDAAAAEELTQQAFIRAWQKLALFQGERRFEPWLMKLVVNVVRSERRSRSRRLAKEQSMPDLAEFSHPGQAVSPGVGLDLEQAIAKLPTRARQVFFLFDVEGYRHEEIATILGVAVGTSKAQLHRARKLLREVLET